MNGRELKDLALLLRCLNWDMQYWAWLAVDTSEFKRFFITHPASPATSVFLKWLDYPSHSHTGLQSKNNSLEIQMENYYSLWWSFKSNLLFQISLKFVFKKQKRRKQRVKKMIFIKRDSEDVTIDLWWSKVAAVWKERQVILKQSDKTYNDKGRKEIKFGQPGLENDHRFPLIFNINTQTKRRIIVIHFP